LHPFHIGISGEDPYLGYVLVQPVVKGIQSQGVIANAKHYIANNQEGYFGAGDRHSTSAIVDERTLMEMYFPPFGGAVEAGVLSVMCGNNLVNGVYVCENNHTGNTMLKAWGGFKGWMCSDYDGTR
jgi:beta-glucosidase